MDEVRIVVNYRRQKDHAPSLHGTVVRPCDATLSEDNEENMVRACEQMVRELFRRVRAKT